jgi:hypothetical protein
VNVEPRLPVGEYRLTLQDVSVDAFWVHLAVQRRRRLPGERSRRLRRSPETKKAPDWEAFSFAPSTPPGGRAVPRGIPLYWASETESTAERLLIDYRKDVAVRVFEPHTPHLAHRVDVTVSRCPGQVVVVLEHDAFSA